MASPPRTDYHTVSLVGEEAAVDGAVPLHPFATVRFAPVETRWLPAVRIAFSPAPQHGSSAGSSPEINEEYSIQCVGSSICNNNVQTTQSIIPAANIYT